MTGPTTQSPASLRTAWNQQSVWSQVANQLKGGVTRSRTAILTLVVVAAVLEVVPATLPESAVSPTARRTLGWVGAAAVTIAAFLRLRGIGREQLSKWVRARSASEALKAEVYLFRTQAGAYAGSVDPSETLNARVADVLGHVSDLQLLAATAEPRTREPPGPLDAKTYMDTRVTSQIEGYYLKRARQYATLVKTYAAIEITFMLATAVLGALVGAMNAKTLGGWVGLLTTLTGALAAHVEGARYEHQVVSFRQTAARLQALCDAFVDRADAGRLSPGDAGRFVERCEEAISAENEAWMTAWVKAT